MKLYFSGIAGPQEADWLVQAGVVDLLADPTDAKHLHLVSARVSSNRRPHCALDSGAYRAWKKGNPISCLPSWFAQMKAVMESLRGLPIDFITMPDVLGDPSATRDNWLFVRDECDRRLGLGQQWVNLIAPVWQWGAPYKDLHRLLAETSGTVAIGGCVPWMRDRSVKDLGELESICRDAGSRLHVLGLNWLEAMARLRDSLLSCDTSKWLDGARYGVVIAEHDNQLSSLDRRSAGFAAASREDLCVLCAQNLDRWANSSPDSPARPERPAAAITYRLDSSLTRNSRQARSTDLVRMAAENEARLRQEIAEQRSEGLNPRRARA